ncbi:hypothetical protein BDZ89DRAFT_71467 [Hymenopellis radicata]|nr:hypothetical protein BDZ89DRAFT_71467 [Hymenopellis radicata]
MSTQSSPTSSPAAFELVVVHTTPTKSQRRRSNATASETHHVLKSSPGKATTVRLPSPSAVKVSITGPRPEDNDSDDNTQEVSDDSQVTVSDIDPADKESGSPSSPSGKITITVLKGDDIDANGARLTFLCPISEDEVTVPVEKKKTVPEPLPLSQSVFTRPSRMLERSVLPLPSLCDGPPTPLEPVFKRSSPPPMQLYKWEPEELEEADVSIRRDSLDSEISSTGYNGDYERDGDVDDPDVSFTQPEQEQEVKDKYDFLPPSRRNSLFQGLDLPRPVRSDSLYEKQEDDYVPGDYMERPSNPVADAYSSDDDDEFGDDILPVPYLTSQIRYDSDSASDSDDESVPAYAGGLPLFRGDRPPVTPPSPVAQLAQIGVDKVMQWVRGTKRRRSESPSPDRDAAPLVADVDEFIHVTKKPKLMALYAH